MRKASTCWKTCGKDVVRRRCRGKGSLQRRGVNSCVQWKVNGTLPSALFSISMHSSHWLADKVQRSTDCFFFPEPPGGVVPRGEGGRCQRIGPVSRPSGPKVRGLRDRFCPLSLHPLAARLGIPKPDSTTQLSSSHRCSAPQRHFLRRTGPPVILRPQKC